MNIACSETHLPFTNVLSPAHGCQCCYLQQITSLGLLIYILYEVFLISFYQTPALSLVQVQDLVERILGFYDLTPKQFSNVTALPCLLLEGANITC